MLFGHADEAGVRQRRWELGITSEEPRNGRSLLLEVKGDGHELPFEQAEDGFPPTREALDEETGF